MSQHNINEIEERLNKLQEEKEALLKQAAEIQGEYLSTYEIRPAGRHVLTIGEELIQDEYAAIVELVKNCYDADSPDATIVFKKIYESNCLEIRIEDNGVGMTPEDVINKWLVPSTAYKHNKRTSEHGRIMQGRKGIGRYAASILGNDFEMITTDKNGVQTTLSLDWNKLADVEYLDQIKIPINTRKTDSTSGTKLIIHSQLSENDYWDEDAIRKLRFELKKLIPPKQEDNDQFHIILSFEDFYLEKSDNISEEIKPYPILDLYDYRISGKIGRDGRGNITYENKKIKNGAKEIIPVNYGETGCGALNIDIRVYDRDKDAIEQLISRGLKDEHDNYVNKLQARQLLNDVNGIGVYRNGFRIRPLGDPDFDWLKLNEQRVQRPSFKIGSNQVVGYVHIQSEELSGLEEKSARDGLKNNEAYRALVNITQKIILELEQRRYIFRKKMEISRPSKKIENQLNGLYDYEPLKQSISVALKHSGMNKTTIEEVNKIIDKEQNKKNEAIEEIKKAVADYQGQATLGKIVNIILHEGRRPLNYFKNQIPNLIFFGNEFMINRNEDDYNEIVKLTNGIADNSELFVKLFGRLDPLAAKKRDTKAKFNLSEEIKNAIDVFSHEIAQSGIRLEFKCDSQIEYTGWKQDIYTIIVNIIDNSIFWVNESASADKKISIIVKKKENGFNVDVRDSGPGISEELLESGVIFEPEFSTKPEGTGLGLAIAGEAANRNKLILTAIQEDEGAHFILCTEE